ncbi:MAG: lipopolysaccharide biosynthesis protein [Treponema sp.]|nr:lipopolysaccharide biosynthesis protein [Treponema sp.]
MEEKNLKRKTKVGMAWNAIEKISVQGISFIISIILARLLNPHDYGIIGMVSIFITFANVFIDSGFLRALIQKQDRNEIDYSTTLIFNVLISIILYLILFIAAPYIANFYKTPELVRIQRVLFLFIIINSLTIVQNAKLQINLDFKSIAIITAISTILSGFIAVIFALKGFGVWALVIQTLSKALISFIGLWIRGKWIPKTGFSIDSFKKLFSYGSKLLFSGLLGTTISNVNNLIIGKIYNPENLGFYTRGQQFPDLTVGTLNSVLTNSTFPMMTALQDNHEELLNVFKRLLKLTSLIVFPAMIGMAILSENIMLVILGEKWLPAAIYLFWLSISNILVPLSSLNLNLLNAIGRSDLFLKIDIAKVPIIILTMIITFPISLKAVVIGMTITSVIYFYMNTFMINKIFKFGFFKQILLVWKTIIASLIMGILVFFIKNIFDNMLYGLIIGILTGIISYTILLFFLREEELYLFFNKLKIYLNNTKKNK